MSDSRVPSGSYCARCGKRILRCYRETALGRECERCILGVPDLPPPPDLPLMAWSPRGG